jgi:TolB-like protein/Tfp pilus assembly protein PilF
VTDRPGELEARSVWARLRRRKVVQWGITYAAGAWIFLQGLEYAVETFGWPESIRALLTLALLFALPMVLVLAWYHGDKGQQRVTGGELAWIMMFGLLGIGGLWLYGGRSESPAPPPGRPTIASTHVLAEEQPSIAVLPFENRSRVPDDAFFVDGIHDDILTQLTKIGSLRVIARTSVEQFRNTRLSTRLIAEQLGVTNILEGGVQRAGDRVRINVQLIDGRTDAHIWAETYDHELTATNIFVIQSEVAARIASALEASLTTDERASVNTIPTDDLDAWLAYQLGKQRMARRTSESLAEAETFFARAIDLDPKFALAHVGLGNTLILQIDYSSAPRAENLARADKVISAALKLDQDLADAWASSALIRANDEEYDRAWEEFRRAIALNPNYATAYHWFSHWLGQRDRPSEALSYAEKSVELDPLSAIINVNLGEQLGRNGRFDEAELRYRKALEIDDSMPATYALLGRLRAYARDDLAGGVDFLEEAMRLDPGNPDHACWLATIYFDLGDDIKASEAIATALEHSPEEACVRTVSAGMKLYQQGVQATLPQASALGATDAKMARFMFAFADISRGRYESARARYADAYPGWLEEKPLQIDGGSWDDAVFFALVLQYCGETKLAGKILGASEQVINKNARLGATGYGIGDVKILALRGKKTEALAALREAKREGWRGPYWRWARDKEPTLASIRGEPEFKAIFAEIERDMSTQRAELAARR